MNTETLEAKLATDYGDGSEVTVIYHAGCADGFCSAWLLHRAYPGARFLPMQHGQFPLMNDIDNRHVFIVDFSFDRLVMEELIEASASLVCLDHHKTAEEELAGLPGCHFDMDRSGAQMTWDYLELGEERHWLVEYTADRDLWKWELPRSRHVSAGIRLVDFDFMLWDLLADRIPLNVADRGEPVVSYLESACQSACKNAKDVLVPVEGACFCVPCVNVTDGNLISDVAGQLASESDDGVGMTYFHDGTDFIFSLRSRGDVDVSKIAKHYGGGGHHNAAGFKQSQFFIESTF